MSAIRSFVYVIESENGLIKIGVGANPKQRVATVHSHSAVRCRLIAVWDAPYREEQDLQKLFVDQHSHSEWFRIEGPVAAFVEEIRGRGLDEIEEWGGRLAHDGRIARTSAETKARWRNPEWRDAAIARMREAASRHSGPNSPEAVP